MTHTLHSTLGYSAIATTRAYGAVVRLLIDTDPTDDHTAVVAMFEGDTKARTGEVADEIAPAALVQGF